MRRLLGAFALLILTTAIPAPAAAQDGTVRLVLLEQTTTATADQPFQIRIGAINESAGDYQNLQLTVAVYAAVNSRSAYDQSLTSGASSPFAAQPRPVRGPLASGSSRSFPPVEVDMAGLTVNALHPVTVELRADHGTTPLAILRTAVVFIGKAEPPEVPLNVSLSFVLDEPIRLRPDGVLLDDTLERTIAAGGRTATIVDALEEAPVAVTLVVSPLMLEELRRMAQGYRILEGESVRTVAPDAPGAVAAAQMLQRIVQIARRPVGVEVVALPYASPSIPALVGAGLGLDLRGQLGRGREVVRTILGVEPSATVFRPPGSALSASALDVLGVILAEDDQTEALLVDAQALEPPIGLTLSPPGAAALRTAGEDLPAIAPDPVLEERTNANPEDPSLAAIWTLGELAALYFELPSIDRGATIVFSEGETPAPEFLHTLLHGLQTEPETEWISPATATRAFVAETSEGDPPLDERRLQQSSRSASVADEVTVAIDRTEELLDALESIEAGSELMTELRRNVLMAESRYLLDREDLAIAFLSSAQHAVEVEFGKIRPPAEHSEITLTSRAGDIPLTIRSEADYPVRVRVALQASKLDFLGGSGRTVTLEPPGQEFVFPVRAQTTGRFGVVVEVQTPTGVPIASSTIIVRSTAYNRVALFVTIGAALFLALWWGRRFLPRRRS